MQWWCSVILFSKVSVLVPCDLQLQPSIDPTAVAGQGSVDLQDLPGSKWCNNTGSAVNGDLMCSASFKYDLPSTQGFTGVQTQTNQALDVHCSMSIPQGLLPGRLGPVLCHLVIMSGAPQPWRWPEAALCRP